MTEGVLNRFLVTILPGTIALIMRIWFLTCRVRVHHREKWPDPLKTGKPVIASFWHYSLLYIFYFLRANSATVMVSASRDGEYIARLAGKFGFSSVRGSRNNKGMEALRGILKAVKSGDSGAIVADGSQGPPLVAQPGAILVASRTGAPIVPMAWSASSYFTIRSWDRTTIPKPFSRIEFCFGDPVYVPKTLTEEQFEEYRLTLEQALNQLYREAWNSCGRNEH